MRFNKLSFLEIVNALYLMSCGQMEEVGEGRKTKENLNVT